MVPFPGGRASPGHFVPAAGLPSFNGGIFTIVDFTIVKSISTEAGAANACTFNANAGAKNLVDTATAAVIQVYMTGGNVLSFEISVVAFNGVGACAGIHMDAGGANRIWPNNPTIPGTWVSLAGGKISGFVAESVTGNGEGNSIAVCEIRPAGGGASLARWRQTNVFTA